MAKHRSHSIEFKRQVVQEYLAGETLRGLAHRHDLSRNLIRIWVQKYEAGALDEDAAAAATIQEYEARIAALERLVGKQALELEFQKGALRSAARSRSRCRLGSIAPSRLRGVGHSPQWPGPSMSAAEMTGNPAQSSTMPRATKRGRCQLGPDWMVEVRDEHFDRARADLGWPDHRAKRGRRRKPNSASLEMNGQHRSRARGSASV